MKSLPYIIAFLAGLFARTAFAALNGWEGYTMDGHDLLLAADCVIMLWAAKGVFTLKLPAKSPERRKPPRENSDSLRRKPDRML